MAQTSAAAFPNTMEEESDSLREYENTYQMEPEKK